MSTVTDRTREELAASGALVAEAFAELMAVVREAGMSEDQIDRVIAAHVKGKLAAEDAAWNRGWVLALTPRSDADAVARELVEAGATS